VGQLPASSCAHALTPLTGRCAAPKAHAWAQHARSRLVHARLTAARSRQWRSLHRRPLPPGRRGGGGAARRRTHASHQTALHSLRTLWARCTRPPHTAVGPRRSACERRGARRAHGHAAGAEQPAAAPSSARTPAMRGALVRLAQSSRAGPARSPLPRARLTRGCARSHHQRSPPASRHQRSLHPRPSRGFARSRHQRSRHQRSEPAARALLTPPSARVQVLADTGSAARTWARGRR